MSDNHTRRQRTQSTGNEPHAGQMARNIREIIESIAIAFVLAFLFRTFEAEAFVIPTGSMAPTLQGRHKDVYCPECGYRFQASASAEESDVIQRLRAEHRAGIANWRAQIAAVDTVAVTCPICRCTIPVAEFQNRLSDSREKIPSDPQPSYNGDRILVSKFAYEFNEPKRWDVLVFKYPGDGNQNYIKRLVGLPGEVIRIFQGDIFVKNRQGGRGPRDLDQFTIERKPPHKILAMMQTVHDTDHDPASLRRAGWPLRWAHWPAHEGAAQAGTWTVTEKSNGQTVSQSYRTDGTAVDVAWLRYAHYVPDMDDWLAVRSTEGQVWDDAARAALQPQLITDLYAYNMEVLRRQALSSQTPRFDLTLRPSNYRLGLHWVGDLVVECEVAVSESRGAILLDLVEAGKHFNCTIDLASGEAKLAIDGLDPDTFAPKAPTSVRGPGTYRLRFANVDDQLLLWINGSLVEFDGTLESTAYDAKAVFGDRERIVPQSNWQDPQTDRWIAGDLSPVGIGSRGAALKIDQLRLYRDLYYIADIPGPGPSGPITDLPRNTTRYQQLNTRSVDRMGYHAMLTQPADWQAFFAARGSHDFPLQQNPANPDGDQFFVLGDNSPSSLDCRLWAQPVEDEISGGVKQPGGSYVERKLLIGKALLVFWPHSWNRIPGIGIPLPFFPNFGDMRRIR